MKKILLLILVFIFTVSGIISQEFVFDIDNYTTIDGATGEKVFDFDTAMTDIEGNNLEPTVLIPVILDDQLLDDINFQDLLPEPTNIGDPYLTTEQLDEIKVTLLEIDPTLDTTVLDNTIAVVDNLINDGMTLSEIEAATPEIYASVENTLVSAIAAEVADGLFPEEDRAELEKTLNIASSAIKMLQGFAQSTANSAVSSSLFGYQGYKLFSVSVGVLGSFALTDPINSASSFSSIDFENDDTLADELDALGLDLGVTMQGFSISAGINLSKVIDNLYVGLVAGSTSINIANDTGVKLNLGGQTVFEDSTELDLGADMPGIDLTMESGIFGIKANYQLVKPTGIPILFRWNGISFGTGVISTYQNVNGIIDISPVVNIDDDTLRAKISLTSNATTIPLEISTGIQLLSLVTVTAGGAIDLQFGSSVVEMNLLTDKSTLGGKILDETINEILGDSIAFPYYDDGGTPAFINPRVNIGLGVGIGPVVFDVSAFYYFSTGLALGANFVVRI